MGKPTINVPFSIAMLNYQRVLIPLKNPMKLAIFFYADSQASDVKLGTVTWKSSALKVTPLESCNFTTLDLGQV